MKNGQDAAGSHERPPQHGDPFESVYDKEHKHGQHADASSGLPLGRIVLTAIGLYIVVVCIVVGLLVSSVFQIKDEAEAASLAFDQVVEAIQDKDALSFQQGVETFSQSVSAVAETTNTLPFKMSCIIPFLGSEVRAAVDMVAVVDELVQNSLMPFAQTIGLVGFDPKNPDGTLNTSFVEAFADLAPQIQTSVDAAATMAQDSEAFRIAPLYDVQETVTEGLSEIADMSGDLFEMVPYLPSMLGMSGTPKTYLLVVQNNAELRSTGGFPGAWCQVSVSNGKIELGDMHGVLRAQHDPDHMVAVTDEELRVFGDRLTWIPGDSNYIPDFPRAADLWRQFWQIETGVLVDGVISMDPFLLQMFLELSGPVTMSDGSFITDENAARMILHDVYLKYPNDNDAQDAFFAEVVSTLSDDVLPNLNPSDMLMLAHIVDEALQEGHLMVWMADPEVQSALVRANAAHELSYDPYHPVAGIYLADDTWSKSSWWLSLDAEILSSWQNKDGTRSYRIAVTLANEASIDEVQFANAYITGFNPNKESPDEILTWMYLYAPAGGWISDIDVQGRMDLQQGTHNGLYLAYGLCKTKVDEQVMVDYTITTAPGAEPFLTIETTPTCQ